MNMLVSYEMIDSEMRTNILEKFILPRLNEQNLVVKKLVIRGIRFIVEKFRELQNDE